MIYKEEHEALWDNIKELLPIMIPLWIIGIALFIFMISYAPWFLPIYVLPIVTGLSIGMTIFVYIKAKY